MALFWHAIGRKPPGINNRKMIRKVNVIVVEDNGYYNSLLVKTLKSVRVVSDPEHRCMVIFHSFTNPAACLQMIRTGSYDTDDLIAYVDYYLGDGITGSHLVKLLKRHNRRSHIIMLSQSISVSEKNSLFMIDFFVRKDAHAPALCRLYLEQFIESKIS